MRKHLQMILPAAVGAMALIACDVPDDGFAELKGEIQIPGTLLSMVVQPGDATSDCDPEVDKGWGDSTPIGDIVPTVYVGLYPRPIEPLQDNIFSEGDESTWRQGCGDIDADDNPVTPPVHAEGACPIGGTTAVYQQTVAGTNGYASFTFEALQLPTGTAYLMAWLDNRCAPDNSTTSNLVWDMSGPPGPVDADGDETLDDENDITIVTPLEVRIGSGSNSLDDPLVLNSALNQSSL